MPGYKHNAAGMCFACGRFPGGEQLTGDFAPLPVRSLRESTIHMLYTYVLRAQEEVETGSPENWWAAIQEDLQWNLRVTDADVRARAVKAFGKLGLRVD